MDYQLAIATERDATLIADISRQTFYDTFAEFNKPEDMKKFMDEQFTRGRLMLEVGQPDMLFYILYHQQEVAGYLKLRHKNAPGILHDQTSLEIARLYATRDYIGRGAGALLMQKAFDHGREMGYDNLWLSVWEHNPRAIRFYEKWGFRIFGEIDFVLGNDVQHDWLMFAPLKKNG